MGDDIQQGPGQECQNRAEDRISQIVVARPTGMD